MLKLLFHVGNEKYVIESRCVVEVVPRVNLLPIAHAPPYLVGILNYRGDLVPIVDLCYLISNKYANSSMNTRIIIVGDPSQNIQTFGFVAEKVTDVINKSESDFVDYRVHIDELPFISRVCEDPTGIIYELNVLNMYSFLSDVLKIKSVSRK